MKIDSIINIALFLGAVIGFLLGWFGCDIILKKYRADKQGDKIQTQKREIHLLNTEILHLNVALMKDNKKKVTKRALLEEMIIQGVFYPEEHFKLSMIESHHLKYYAVEKFNRLFGMKHPTRRETTSLGRDNSGHAIYKTWQDAVTDVKLWQESHKLTGKEFTPEQYRNFLRTSGYIAGASNNYELLMTKIKLP